MPEQAKHTSGPWTVNRQANVIQGCDNRFVVDLNGARLADARLIAAAPDLLEALQAMLAAFATENIDPVVAFASIEKARAAIARATTS